MAAIYGASDIANEMKEAESTRSDSAKMIRPLLGLLHPLISLNELP